MKHHLSWATRILTIALLATPLAPACRPQAAESAATSPSVRLVFAGAVGALEVLDRQHRDQMAANLTPTPEDFQKAQARSAQLHRLRDSLAIVRSWLSGEIPEDSGRVALRDSVRLLQLIIDELRAQGHPVPPEADAALAAVLAFA